MSGMAERPFVRIKGPNRAEELRAHLEQSLPLFKHPGVLGITLNGGISRGFADELSEIDVTLFLAADAFREWQSGRAPIPLGITVLAGQLYDIKIVDLAAEQARTWNNIELWDLSYAEILFDPTLVLAALFRDKRGKKVTPEESEGRLFSCWWYFRLAGDIWMRRDDPLQGHAMLNKAVEALLDALFLANGEYVPHEKWIVHMSRTLAWTPNDWERRLAQAMSTGDQSITSLRERQEYIQGLWDELDGYVASRCCPGLPVRVMQKTFYELLQWLADKGTVSLDAWQAHGSLNLLNMDPFHRFVTIANGNITLDRGRLAACAPEEMYAWHYQVLRAVVEKNPSLPGTKQSR